MLKLLQLIFHGHVHKWKIIEKYRVYGPTDIGPEGCVGNRYTLQCEFCGNIKFKGK